LQVLTKPFEILAEGLFSKNSRHDKSAIKLFAGPLRQWEKSLGSRLCSLSLEIGLIEMFRVDDEIQNSTTR
jgi:hypothetical protein